jgi:acyl carrier protein
LIAYLRAEVATVLGYNGHEQVEIDRDFFDMGMDSLMVVELGRNLQRSLEQNFPISMVFEHPSIEDFAGVFSQEILPPEIVVRRSL